MPRGKEYNIPKVIYSGKEQGNDDLVMTIGHIEPLNSLRMQQTPQREKYLIVKLFLS